MASIATPLSRGGMGAIFKHTESTVIKVSARPEVADTEARVLQHVGASPFVVPFHGLRTTSAGPGLILERCACSLEHFVQNQPHQRLHDPMSPEAQELAVMMIAALADLHSRGVVHGDIKPANFLLSCDGCLQLCDFGLSRLGPQPGPPQGCTLLYASPALLQGEQEGYAADWWALGVSLYQLLRGLPTWPFAPRDSAARMLALPRRQRLGRLGAAVARGRPFFGALPPSVEELLRGLLQPEPCDRWGLTQVLGCGYPAACAFSRVALRFPRLAPHVERLLVLRRHSLYGEALTPDGRLPAPPFAPCPLRSDSQLLRAEKRQAAVQGGSDTAPAADCPSPRTSPRQQAPAPAPPTPARGPSYGDLEVHEQMQDHWRHMLQSRRKPRAQASAAAAPGVPPPAPAAPPTPEPACYQPTCNSCVDAPGGGCDVSCGGYDSRDTASGGCRRALRSALDAAASKPAAPAGSAADESACPTAPPPLDALLRAVAESAAQVDGEGCGVAVVVAVVRAAPHCARPAGHQQLAEAAADGCCGCKADSGPVAAAGPHGEGLGTVRDQLPAACLPPSSDSLFSLGLAGSQELGSGDGAAGDAEEGQEQAQEWKVEEVEEAAAASSAAAAAVAAGSAAAVGAGAGAGGECGGASDEDRPSWGTGADSVEAQLGSPRWDARKGEEEGGAAAEYAADEGAAQCGRVDGARGALPVDTEEEEAEAEAALRSGMGCGLSRPLAWLARAVRRAGKAVRGRKVCGAVVHVKRVSDLRSE